MSQDADRKFWRARNPILWGLALSFGLAALVTLLGLQTTPGGTTRYTEFLNLESNQIGDTVAGLFAPLALIWIVITVWLQSQELAEQRRELSLTREELRLAREAQERQLQVMQEQADIFRSELRQREEAENDTLLDELLHSLIQELAHGKLRRITWYCSPVEDGLGNVWDPKGERINLIQWFPSDGAHEEVHIRNVMHSIRTVEKEVCRIIDQYQYRYLPESPSDLGEFIRILQSIESTSEKSSGRLKERVRRLSLEGALSALESIRVNAKIWRSGGVA